MIYLLDTNTCIQFLNDRNLAVARKLSTLKAEDIFLRQIVKAELYYGAYKSSYRAKIKDD